MSRSICVILLSLGYALTIVGQGTISIDDLVKQVYLQSEETALNSYKQPWLDEINVRSETRDWELKRQSYSLRLSPISLGERRASSKLYNSWQQELVYLKAEKIYDQVADIHEAWVDHDFMARKINVDDQILDLLYDVEKVTAKQSLVDADNLSLLIAVRSRIAKLKNRIELKQKRKADKLASLSDYVEGDYSLQADSIDLQGYLQAAKEILIIEDRPFVAASDVLELQTLNNEMELERAENNRVLDFVALEYRGPHDNQLDERVSLGMSFNLPFYTKNTLSIAKIKVEQEREQYKIQMRKEASLAEMKEIKESILSDVYELDKYQQLFRDIESDNQQLITNISTQEILNPIIKLNHKIQILENRLFLLDIQEKIVLNYLEYLKSTDKYIMGVGSLNKLD